MQKQNKATSVNEGRIVQKVLKSVEKQKQDKFIVYNFETTVPNTFDYRDVTGIIDQGTTQSQRIGNQIRLIHARLRWSAVVADTTNFVRLIVFRWRVSSTADVPQATELFVPNSSLQFYSEFLPNKPSRFQVVFDKTVALSSEGLACTYYEADIPLGWKTSFDLGVNTGKDHLYFGFFSDSGVANHPSMKMSLTAYYHDTA